MKDLIELLGWDAIFGLLCECDVAMKLSSVEFPNPGKNEDTRKYLAGLANRITKEEFDPSLDVFHVTATNPAERGRCTADIYALKKSTSIMNLENFLPDSSRVDKKSYLQHYLSKLTGATSVDVLTSISDIMNKVMSN